MNFENLPQELKKSNQWLLWKKEERNGKKTKVPYTISGKKADTTDPSTWGKFEEVVSTYYSNRRSYDGIGFVFSKNDSYVGVDFDDCIDDKGNIQPDKKTWIDKFNSYTEKSQSGEGIHVICKGKIPCEKGKKKQDIEIYEHSRFFAITGDGGGAIKENQQAINELYTAVFEEKKKPEKPKWKKSPAMTDKKIMELCRLANNRQKFQKLFDGICSGYSSQSEADLAFCSIIAFYSQDEEQIDYIFRQSKLYRDKWDEKHGDDTYGNITIQKALSEMTETYQSRDNRGQDNWMETKNYLQRKYKFRYNFIKKTVEFTDTSIKMWQEIDSRSFNGLLGELIENNLSISDSRLKVMIENDEGSPVYNPILDYFESLPPFPSDSPDYIKQFTDCIALKNETESDRDIFETYFKKWFVSILTGVYPNKYCNHTIFILVGEKQGEGKTTILNKLIPRRLQDYLKIALPRDERECQYALSTNLLINIDELESFYKKDIEYIKSLTTTREFKPTLKYDKYPTVFKRIASLCASTNKVNFLSDPTGTRRFLVFEVDTIRKEEEQNFNINLMFAQAKYLYNTGYKYWFDGCEIEEINRRNESFSVENFEEELVMKYFEPVTKEEFKESQGKAEVRTTSEIVHLLSSVYNENITDDKMTLKKVGEFLAKHGFEKTSKRFGKNSLKAWIYRLSEYRKEEIDEPTIDY